MGIIITDKYGNEQSGKDTAHLELIRKYREAKEEIARTRSQAIRAKYDAAQTHTGNENHWAQADNLSPQAANSSAIRKKLRSRSRYECIENNPYLKGMILSIANDFVGSGPKLQITDRRFSRERRRHIEKLYQQRIKKIKLRRKLWRMRIGKIVDGEGVAQAFTNNRLTLPTKLDWKVIETDQLAHADSISSGEVDGLRLDENDQPLQYHILDQHPGSTFFFPVSPINEGTWVDPRFVMHWFRQDRGWHRGIPETTPSLPLCAILRRYTLAVLKAAEFEADIAGVLETEGPPNQSFWTAFEDLGAATGGEVFPTEHGMFVTTPWGYKLRQFQHKAQMQDHEMFVNGILREIARPILVPFNRAVGSSKDSNMASAVVDEEIYKDAQWSERYDCEDEVLEKDLSLWWEEAVLTNDYLEQPLVDKEGRIIRDGDLEAILVENSSLLTNPPEHCWRWDQVGIEHTDPSKVETAWSTKWEHGFVTDRDIQEMRFNRDVDEFYEDAREMVQRREEIGMPIPNQSVRYRTLTEEEDDLLDEKREE